MTSYSKTILRNYRRHQLPGRAGRQETPTGTTMIGKYVVEKCERKRREQCVHYKGRLSWRGEGGENLPEMNLLCCQVVRAMSGSLALKQQGFVSMSKTHVITRGHVDIPGMGCLLESSQCLRAAQN